MMGEVADIFTHRFVIKTETGTILADLGPKWAEQIRLEVGDRVELKGEMKPSELTVQRIAKGRAKAITIDPDEEPHHDDEQEAADPKFALETATVSGLAGLGEPCRKPKHFEFLGCDLAATWSSCTRSLADRYARRGASSTPTRDGIRSPGQPLTPPAFA